MALLTWGSPTLAVAISCAVVTALALSRILSKPHKPLPPGPPRLPVIGNLHQAPQLNPWRSYQEWTKQYGPIFYLRFGLQDIIMLGTAQSASDLLDKRGNIYSNRPKLIMGGECLSKGLRLLLMPYDARYRNHQRLVSVHLTMQHSQAYRPLQDLESRQLVYEMLSRSDFAARFHRYAASFMFSLVYGIRLPTGNEPELKAVGDIVRRVLEAAQVGVWVVDALPILNYLPKFLAPWKRLADKWHAIEVRWYLGSLTEAQKRPGWNYTKQSLAMKEAKGMEPVEVAFDMGTIYEAGTDTTTMALEVFVLAAVLNPSFVKKAHEELDEVVGLDDLPSFDHRPKLPYLNAAVNEVLRWRPVSAGGIPHAVTQDDEYMGYHIPKGATVIGNHWSISMDEGIFGDPYDFRPERWIKDADLPQPGFGFGRRVCTGQHVARNSLYINMARLLWTFDIGYAFENGQQVPIDPMAMTQGFNSRPVPFKASFKIRDSGRKTVVEKAWAKAEKDVNVILEKIGRSK